MDCNLGRGGTLPQLTPPPSSGAAVNKKRHLVGKSWCYTYIRESKNLIREEEEEVGGNPNILNMILDAPIKNDTHSSFMEWFNHAYSY